MSPWQLRLVGTPAAQCGPDSLPLPFERRVQLVALLALRREWVQRAELAALLWPEAPRALASTNLRKALFRLHDAPWGHCVESDGTLLRVTTATDVDVFAALARDGRAAEALAVAQGELLAGFDDDANEGWTEWLRRQRERWRTQWRSVALQRLAQAISTEEGIALSNALLQADPLDEAALQAQLGYLAQAGQAARAREVYRAFAQRLHEELGLSPADASRALYETLQSRPTPAAANADEDGYVGRTAELRRISELMRRPECRLLAIVGPGGIGKTRLARRALGEVAPLFADGASFVALEDLDSAAGLLPRMALAAGMARCPARDGIAALSAHLRHRSMLMVLDNFEPLASEASPLLEQLLAGAPGLKLIVTSRERLALEAQWALPLEGLPCPEAEDMDRLEAFDAARLFVAAARRADAALDAAAERAAIVDICRLTDGMPLALELAAAWTRLMRCEDIARELRQGSELLRASNPAFPARQASLDAVFEQSWRLLGERERAALARLSVFRGGFTVEAARTVSGAALPVLGALTDKSLLRKEGARLALHPLMQQYATLRLREGRDLAAARNAHAAHFEQLLWSLRDAVRAGDAQALREVDNEFENCWLALSWLAEHGPATALAAACRPLTDHADHRGQPHRCLALFLQVLAGPVAAVDDATRARVLALAAHLHYRLDHFAEAETMAHEALAAPHGDDAWARETHRIAQQVLGSATMRLGRLDDARRHYRAVVALAEGPDAAYDRAPTLDHLALIEKRLGNLDAALSLSLESLALHRRLADPAGIALCLNNLASLHLQRREPDAAEGPLIEALALCERGGLASTHGLVLCNLCELALARGELDAAARYGERAVEVAAASGHQMLVAWVQVQLATVAVKRGDFAAARVSLASACETALTLDTPALKAVALLAFAQLLHAQGHGRAARRTLALGAAEAALGPADRKAFSQQLADWGGPDANAMPSMTLDEMLHRIELEASLGHAALIAFLGA